MADNVCAIAPMPNISGSLFSTKANMDNSNMQHLIDAETKREIAQLIPLLRSFGDQTPILGLVFYSLDGWIKVMFGPITVKIKEQPVKDLTRWPPPLPLQNRSTRY